EEIFSAPVLISKEAIGGSGTSTPPKAKSFKSKSPSLAKESRRARVRPNPENRGGEARVRELERQVAELRKELMAARRKTPGAGSCSSGSTDGMRGHFDTVPADQALAIARRLDTAKELILRHGRAYDYRIHPNRVLERYLERLDR